MDKGLVFGPADPAFPGTRIIAYFGVKPAHPIAGRGPQGIEGLHRWHRVVPWVDQYHQCEPTRFRFGTERQDNWQQHIAESRCAVLRWGREQTDRDRLCGRRNGAYLKDVN